MPTKGRATVTLSLNRPPSLHATHDRAQLLHPILVVRQRRILNYRIDPLLFFLDVITNEEDELVAQKQLSFKSSFGAVIEDQLLTFAQLSLEWFDYVADDAPIFITADAINDLGFAHADARHNLRLVVIMAEIAQRRPFLIVLSYRRQGKR